MKEMQKGNLTFPWGIAFFILEKQTALTGCLSCCQFIFLSFFSFLSSKKKLVVKRTRTRWNKLSEVVNCVRKVIQPRNGVSLLAQCPKVSLHHSICCSEGGRVRRSQLAFTSSLLLPIVSLWEFNRGATSGRFKALETSSSSSFPLLSDFDSVSSFFPSYAWIKKISTQRSSDP
jgi:hypothetical protein